MDDIARFGAYLSDEKHSSRNTVSSYLRDTTQFAEYLHNYCDIDLREADSAAVQDYMDWMLSHGKSAASVTRFLASVKSFYSYMVAAGELKKNPAQGGGRRQSGAEISGDPHRQRGGAVSGTAGVRGRQGLPGSCHAGAAVRHRHPGQ